MSGAFSLQIPVLNQYIVTIIIMNRNLRSCHTPHCRDVRRSGLGPTIETLLIAELKM
jgi:hypothetical protein